MKLRSQPTYPEALRRKNFPACGRLIVLQSLTSSQLNNLISNQTENFAGFTSINFPSMPDAIELARRAEYKTASAYGFPDGLHAYMGTSILKIPFGFKLHFADTEYCPKGAKTILEVAGTMQALVAPFGPEGQTVVWGSEAEKGLPTSGNDADVKANAQDPTLSVTPPSNINPPATCILELIRTEYDSVGIVCVGYVEDVKVRLLGPWMRSVVLGSQNLPTAGEFEFTFVHHPGHGNAFRTNGRIEEQQAFADTIKGRLYNTIGLISSPKNFLGFGQSASLPPGQAQAPQNQLPQDEIKVLSPAEQEGALGRRAAAAQHATEQNLDPSGLPDD